MSTDADQLNPTPVPTPVPAGVVGQPEVIKKCTDLVQDFRDGKITKVVACTKIMQTLPSAFVEGGSGEQAAQSYFEILDQTEKELAEAAKCGTCSGGAGTRGDRPRFRSPNAGGNEGGSGAAAQDEGRGDRGRTTLVPPTEEAEIAPALFLRMMSPEPRGAGSTTHSLRSDPM